MIVCSDTMQPPSPFLAVIEYHSYNNLALPPPPTQLISPPLRSSSAQAYDAQTYDAQAYDAYGNTANTANTLYHTLIADLTITIP